MNYRPIISRLIRSSRGQSLIEFGMVLPLLLVIGFIITEFGRALWVQNVLTEAAGSAARAAVVSDIANYQGKAEDAANRILDQSKMGTSMAGGAQVSTDLVTANGHTSVRVKVTRDFAFIPGSAGNGSGLETAPFAGKKNTIPLGTMTIAGVSVMQIQSTGFGVQWPN